MRRALEIAFLPLLLLTSVSSADITEHSTPAFTDEYAKQQQIFKSEDEGLLQGYVTDRSFANYTRFLPAAFVATLASLGASDRWIDIGAGQGYAILDYYSPKFDAHHTQGRPGRSEKAKAVAISIEDRRTPEWRFQEATLKPGTVSYFWGKNLRDYSPQELGQFQLITDVYGGFSYTNDLSAFMTKALDLLVLNGSLYTLLQDIRTENNKNSPSFEGSRFLTEINKADGTEVGMCAWLKKISCVEVICEPKNWKPAIEMYALRKVCNNVEVPKLTPVEYTAGSPPWRRFQFTQ